MSQIKTDSDKLALEDQLERLVQEDARKARARQVACLKTVLVEEPTDEGPYLIPVPSGLAEQIGAALETQHVRYQLIYDAKRADGFPYSHWRAMELLAQAVPELYGFKQPMVSAALLLTFVKPDAVYELVRELDALAGDEAPSAQAKRDLAEVGYRTLKMLAAERRLMEDLWRGMDLEETATDLVSHE